MRRAGAVVAAVALTAGAACSRGSASHASVLDGRPRVPSIEGVATEARRQRVTVAGKHYGVDPRLESFSPYDGQPAPLAGWRGQYVQAGVRHGRVVWISGFGPPLGRPAAITYTGRALGVVDGRLHFAGGVTLRMDRALKAPTPGTTVQAVVYTGRRAVIGYSEISGGSR